MRRLVRNGKSFFLAYDQGLEHGPTDFNDKNIMDIVNLIKEKMILNGMQKHILKLKIV
jgi:DhnA family fructose-bisphosphate aldolase class Ia